MALVEDIKAWLNEPDEAAQRDGSETLIARAYEMDSVQKLLVWSDLLTANVARHLAALIGVIQDCRLLGRLLLTSAGTLDEAILSSQQPTNYIYHRDPWMALWPALGAVAGISLGCLFWICTGWSDGAIAISILGVCCALFGNVDALAPNITKYLMGSVIGAGAGLIYSFAILPQIADFASLATVLAPILLFSGWI